MIECDNSKIRTSSNFILSNACAYCFLPSNCKWHTGSGQYTLELCVVTIDPAAKALIQALKLWESRVCSLEV
jgi:hypothetical protein